MQSEKNISQRNISTPILIFFIATLILALEFALFFVRWIAIATVLAIGMSVLFTPLMRLMKRKLKVPAGVGAVVFFTVSLGSVAAISFLVYVLVAEHFMPLLQQGPDLVQNAQARITGFLEQYPTVQARVDSMELGNILSKIPQHLLEGLKIGASAIGGFIFVLVLALYLAMEPGYYVDGFLSAFPASKRAHYKKIMEACASTLRNWFGAQLIAMFAVGGATAIGLLLVGVNNWFLFGVLTAILDIVPYIGPLIAAGTVVLATLATEPEKVWWVVGIFVLMQQLEGNLVIPLVMKGRADLPPAHLMVLMLVLGTWFGILGVLLAPGLLAVARTIYIMGYLPMMERK